MALATAEVSYIVTIDDDPLVTKIVEGIFGIKSLAFSSASALLANAELIEPLVFLVDVHLANNESGLSLIPKILRKWPRCPIIVMTCDQNDTIVSKALAAGAHDFIYKPLRPGELRARVSRRREQLEHHLEQDQRAFGDIVVYVSRDLLVGPHGKVPLSSKETSFLSFLIHTHHSIVKLEDIKARVWGDSGVSDSAFHRKLHEIRKQLRSVGSKVELKSIYGKGFMLRLQNHEENDVLVEDKKLAISLRERSKGTSDVG